MGPMVKSLHRGTKGGGGPPGFAHGVCAWGGGQGRIYEFFEGVQGRNSSRVCVWFTVLEKASPCILTSKRPGDLTPLNRPVFATGVYRGMCLLSYFGNVNKKCPPPLDFGPNYPSPISMTSLYAHDCVCSDVGTGGRGGGHAMGHL